jgi:hypothetical protein
MPPVIIIMDEKIFNTEGNPSIESRRPRIKTILLKK